MGKAGRDWLQIYVIYGTDEWHTALFLAIHAAVFLALAVLLLLNFSSAYSLVLATVPPFVTPAILRFALGFTGSVAALSSLCLLFAAANVLHSSLALRWDVAQRMVAAVPDWSAVRTALDVGCQRGMLLNSIAIQLKKAGSSGRVVGLGPVGSPLRRAAAEGVQEYVTCREGDARRLPFGDGYFDFVASAAHVGRVGKGEAGAAERGRAIGEMVRVLKPGGVGVLWDLVWVPEYVQRLHELRMEEVRVSERFMAYMVGSHIVSFRKPLVSPAGDVEAAQPLDWRANVGIYNTNFS